MMPVFFRHSCDVISGLFSEPGYSIRTARGTKNFDFIFIFFWQPVQIHIHVHMHLAGTSLCQRCRMPDEIPSATNRLYQASLLNGLSGYLINNTIYSRKSNASHNNFPIIRTVLRIQQFSPDRHE